MAKTNNQWKEQDHDALIIPTRDGYKVIPMPDLRQPIAAPADKGVHQSTEHTRGSRRLGDLFRLKNIAQFLMLILGMVSLLAYLGWWLGGILGFSVAIGLTFTSVLIGNNLSIKKILRSDKFRPISLGEGFSIHQTLKTLSQKAGLNKPPALYLMEQDDINAFTIADKDNSAVVISRGLANRLSKRELFGVLAHEVAHLKNGDIRLMLFANQITRLTSLLAMAGQIMLLALIPVILFSQLVIPWSVVLMLFAAPLLSQLALIAVSRNREYKADIDAVELLGDHIGLASALKKIDTRYSFLKRVYAPYTRELPELLRTHPNTGDRIERLMSYGNERVIWR